MKIAIVGYGNIGRACEKQAHERGVQIEGIFTRREPESLASPYGSRFFRQSEAFEREFDVALICTGSANDVEELAYGLAERVNTLDSFDTHAKMREYVTKMDDILSRSGHLGFVGMGWDPGVFSLIRALGEGIMPNGCTSTFWGRGVSQGHSEAVRHIEGVKYAKQYTVPKPAAIALAREGRGGELSERDRHMRVCYVVAEHEEQKERIECRIKQMPNYFAPYDTQVVFVDERTFLTEHSGLEHGGFVLRTGNAGGTDCGMELSLSMKSNPDFTASVMMSYAFALDKLYKAGERGARTILDVPVSALQDGDSVRFV